jgi:iron complex outermembrane recepter protein
LFNFFPVKPFRTRTSNRVAYRIDGRSDARCLTFFTTIILRKFILLWPAFLLANLLYGQDSCTGTLSGKVISTGGQPVPGAIVRLNEDATQTDSDGVFTFRNICEGKHNLKIQSMGFLPAERIVQYPSRSAVIISMEQEVRELNEVVVNDEALQTEHAHNFSKMGEKELSRSAGKSLGETLKEMSGVNTIQSGPGIFKPVIHGVHSQRVLILNHGIRQEGQQWGAEHAPEIDPFIASDIVVIKDASSIKYGTDALGGVIIVNPPVLPEKNIIGGSLQSVLQSNGRSGTLSGMIEGGIKGHDGWGWRVQGTGKRTGDFQAADYMLTNTGVRELNFSAAAGYHHDDGGIEMFYSRFTSDIGILRGASISTMEELVAAMDRDEPLYTRDFSYDIAAPRQRVEHNLLKLNGHLNTKNGTLRAQYGYQANDRSEYDIRKGSLTEVPSLNLNLQTHSVETEWERVWQEKKSLCLGVTAILQDNRNVQGTRRIPFIPNFVSASGGVFGVAKFFLKNWVVDIGGRYDYRDYQVSGFDFKNSLYRSAFNFHNASASLGATVQLPNNGYFSSNLSTAWRPPHVAELYSLGTHQSAAAIEFGLLLNDSTNEVMDISAASPDVEQAVKWVNTWQKKWDRVTVSVTGYANYIFDYIYLRPTGVTRTLRGVFPSLRYTQTDAFFTGLDLEANFQLKHGFSIAPRATLLHASDITNDDYLVYIPSNRVEVKFRYERTKEGGGGFFAEARPKYVARQNRAPRVISVEDLVTGHEENPSVNESSIFDFTEAPPAYWLLNLGAGYSIPIKKTRVDIYATVENALNTSYREYTNRFRYYSDDLGRNISLSAKLIF